MNSILNLPLAGPFRSSRFAGMLFVLLLVCLSLASAQETDVDGCKDSPLLSRYPKTTIYSCDHKDFDSAALETNKDGSEQGVEGEVTVLQYTLAPDISELAVYRNFRAALNGAGYSMVYEKSPYKFTARKGGQFIGADIGGGAYTLTLVKRKEMEQVVTADAKAMSQALDQSGHIAVYGIEFETAKADILPASDAALQQVLELLKQNITLKLRVEGHTDNVGKREVNQKLSERRAGAVVDWLVAHGVAKDRLSAQGFADSKPVGDNSTEDGRAKNRRVELVKVS